MGTTRVNGGRWDETKRTDNHTARGVIGRGDGSPNRWPLNRRTNVVIALEIGVRH
jgi:hypothetical protein